MASVSGAGATMVPMRQPVMLKVLEQPLIVTVRSRMPRQRGDGEVLALVEDVLVDLVGDRVGVVPDAQLGDPLELLAREHPAGGVAGRVDDDGAGARRERGRQAIEVEGLAGRERDVHRLRAAEDRVRAVVLVERLEDDHLLARIDQRQERRGHGLGGAAGDGDLGLGIDRHAVPVRVLSRRRRSRSRFAPQVMAYWLMSARMARAAASLSTSGAGKLGKPCARLMAPWCVGEPGHSADDRLGETVGAAGGVHGWVLAQTGASAPPRLAIRHAAPGAAPDTRARTG